MLPPAPAEPAARAALFGWRRLVVALGIAFAVTLLLRSQWTPGLSPLLARTILLGLVGVLVFGVFERWPRRLPRRLPRWVLQVVGVGLAMPLTTTTVWLLSTAPAAPPFWLDRDRLDGFMMLTFLAILLAPWTALGALLRHTEAVVRDQALAFDLQRSELEREALNARLRLLQGQIAPHFLFNTLANVQALVDTGSPHASRVLGSLIAYLRAAVPALDDLDATLGHELSLVKAYLDLMQMRMPDRLRYEVTMEDAAGKVPCPPTAVLTLVENAVRHGIDPSEEGGRIDIDVTVKGDRCLIRVVDTGVGLGVSGGGGLGTGLQTLRQRLQIAYRDEASLRVAVCAPKGVTAELDIPAG